MKKVPELRFKEFNEEWKEEKLGDIGHFYKGKNISKEDLSNKGIECIRYGELYTTYKEKIDLVFNKTRLQLEKLFLSQKNDILIPSSGETAIDISTSSCILKENVALGGDITIIRTKNDGIFLAYYLNYLKKRDIAKLAQGISIIHLYINHLKSLNLKLPSRKEQQKIALFLSSIDKKIELTDKKLEFLEKYKKGLIQKLLTGKIRFPGFNDEWKEEKLGNFIKIQGGYAFKNKLFKEKGIPIIRISNLSIDGKYTNINNLVYYDKIENDNNFIIKRNDLLIAMSGATAGKVSVYNKKNIAYLNQRVGLFKLIKFDKLDYNYMTQYAFSNFFNNQLKSLLATSAQPNISSKDIEKLKIKLSSLPEQQKIASFLSAIDKKIELIKSRLENLKGYKKGLLQKMFV